MDSHHTDGGSTRRELLKRGAVAGGALLWATAELLKVLNVKGTVQTLGCGDVRQYVVLVPPELTVVAAFSNCGARCGPPVLWKGGLLFNPCPPGTEVAATEGPGSTTTTTT